ncbi:unnamed protein product [Cuscuta epithymum]|uniref:Uncharacterized protein n=1 Tax=Cuscuta epithymum TaxID=186058 RepID=A0AAV0FGB8_9ASTE|nr:unnamed protein product [Cuscuta epithymum]
MDARDEAPTPSPPLLQPTLAPSFVFSDTAVAANLLLPLSPVCKSTVTALEHRRSCHLRWSLSISAASAKLCRCLFWWSLTDLLRSADVYIPVVRFQILVARVAC